MLDVALVNNMPGAAFARTERQWVRLLDAAAGPGAYRLRRYHLSSSAPGIDLVAVEAYRPVDELWNAGPDVLVVTGTTPCTPDLPAERCWDDLVRLLTRATGQVPAVVLSCLAAHAALLAFDGVDRTPLAAKRSGVFAHELAAGHRLAAGLADTPIPHSRRNDVAGRDVVAAGYDLVLTSPVAGWAVAAARRDDTELLLLQGHPEYDGDSLLREYRRDAAGWLRGEVDEPPVLPLACTAPGDAGALAALHHAVVAGDADLDGLYRFAWDDIAGRVPAQWSRPAATLLANTLRAAGLPAAGATSPVAGRAVRG